MENSYNLASVIQNQYIKAVEQVEEAFYSDLFEIGTLFPDIEEEILDNIRFGLFSKPKEKCIAPFLKDTCVGVLSYTSEASRIESEVGELQINFQQLQALDFFIRKKLTENQTLRPQCPESFLFSPGTWSQLENKFLEVYFDYEDRDAYCKQYDLDPKISLKSKDLDWTENWEISAMVPDCEDLWPDINQWSQFDWRWESISQYENWRVKLMDQNFSKAPSYVQIGGYGKFIQHSYKHYIAQINNEVGDAGALFLFMGIRI